MKAFLKDIAALFAFGGLFLFGFQSYHWFKYGNWPPYTLKHLVLLTSQNAFTSWLEQPQSWIGLQKMTNWALDFIPISIALIGIGYLIYCYADKLPKEEMRSSIEK